MVIASLEIPILSSYLHNWGDCSPKQNAHYVLLTYLPAVINVFNCGNNDKSQFQDPNKTPDAWELNGILWQYEQLTICTTMCADRL